MSEQYTFENGPNCRGRGSIEDGRSLDQVEIRKQYPLAGHWSRNLETTLAITAVEGATTVVFRSSRVVYLTPGESVEVPAGQWYAYVAHGVVNTVDGWSQLELTGTPPFSGEQYEVRPEEEVLIFETLTTRLEKSAEELLTDDDVAFLAECFEWDEKLNYVYARLIEEGFDPDEVLVDAGVLEGSA